ncbi:SRPBCC domain-containing protein [Haliangium ochraceum]|uniref:Polyketide cyclase/dehydrase n=1 Tax=Haliangium ochraceum (strain DSM 14365 / JCM 11303 / SMP-2) TaxID=502025 RepID=D0LTD0_HALO1|nr:SRPBCC domain-containing protein [Haliangium ochraceum]ACY13825.1 Polyketide cyclase/dehydrase [Haliangium ochraceum DSM 14365]
MSAATKNESTFRLSYSVAVSIAAKPEEVWARLTDAAAFPSWNTTVTSIEGEIAEGQRLAIRVPVAPGRVFKPRVTEFEPAQRMVWSDGMAPMFKGERRFVVSPTGDGGTEFTMSETFAGLMLPMIKKSLPDFGPVFEQYAQDLKRACEA